MKKAILAKKVGMTQVFTEAGILLPVTVLEAGPCVVIQKKNIEKDGYDAIQVGFVDAKLKGLTKPLKVRFDKANVTPKKYLREFKLEDISSYEVGSEIKVDVFAKNDVIDVVGTSKGRGTLGPIARHHFSRGPETHGSKYHRGIGGLSGGTTPGKVKKGRKMSGRVGHERVTVQNLTVVDVIADKNLILIKGSVPGPKGSLVLIRDAVKA